MDIAITKSGDLRKPDPHDPKTAILPIRVKAEQYDQIAHSAAVLYLTPAELLRRLIDLYQRQNITPPALVWQRPYCRWNPGDGKYTLIHLRCTPDQDEFVRRKAALAAVPIAEFIRYIVDALCEQYVTSISAPFRGFVRR